MNFKEYYSPLSDEEKIILADRLGTSVDYLYQIEKGYRRAGNKILDNMFEATNGKVSVLSFFPPEKTTTA